MGSAKIDILNMVMSAGLVVQLVLLLLVLFSITSWAIILIKYRYMRRAFRESALFIEFFWKSRDLTDAFTKSKQLQGSPVARIFRVAYLELRKLSKQGGPAESGRRPTEKASLGARTGGIDNVKRALRRAINTEMTRMTQMVPFPGHDRQYHPVYRSFRDGLGHHEFLPWDRPDGLGKSGRGGPRHLRSAGGDSRGAGRRHPGGHCVQFLHE